MLDGVVIGAGQCNIADLALELMPYSDPKLDYADEWLLAVEKPFVGESQSARSVITHAMNCGEARGLLKTLWPRNLGIWQPAPSEWRSKLPGMPMSPASKAKAKAIEIARALGIPCKGLRDSDKFDMAEAICIAIAAGRKYYMTGGKLK